MTPEHQKERREAWDRYIAAATEVNFTKGKYGDPITDKEELANTMAVFADALLAARDERFPETKV